VQHLLQIVNLIATRSVQHWRQRIARATQDIQAICLVSNIVAFDMIQLVFISSYLLQAFYVVLLQKVMEQVQCVNYWATLLAQSAKMRPLATVVVLSVCVFVCLLNTTVRRAKTDEPIEMSFRLWTRMGPRNHVLGTSPDPHEVKEQFWVSQLIEYRCNSEICINGLV